MKISEMVKETVESGITPIALYHEKIRFYDSPKILLRSSLIINSLDLGVLTPRQYRYVARRSKKGDALVERHIEKLFAAMPQLIEENPSLECVTIPIYPRTLVSGLGAQLVFNALGRYPKVTASRLCVEISSDVLYEDLDKIKACVQEFRDLGIKIAVFEVGDEFCPVFRLSELDFDYAFAHAALAEKLSDEETAVAATQLSQIVHLFDAQVIATELDGDEQVLRAKASGLDGYSIRDRQMADDGAVKEVDADGQ